MCRNLSGTSESRTGTTPNSIATRFFVCLDMALTTPSTSSFSLTNPGESADHSLK